MLERLSPFFRILSIVLAGLFLYQASRLFIRRGETATFKPNMDLISPAAPSTNAAPAKETNAPAAPRPGVRRSGASVAADLPAPVKAKVDRITESEILGAIVRPLPMALLGIAGDHAFLRSPNGQTGLVKEGDSLGDLKLLRIGANRVLVEHEDQKKELMIHSGFGGETLLEKPEK